MAKERIEDYYAEDEEQIYVERFNIIEFQYDLNKLMVQLPEKHQKIFNCVLAGYSDIQIAEGMKVSRQYVNRIRKQIGKNLYGEQQSNKS